MVNVEFLVNKSGLLLGFQISGHSNFAENGSDIVCAAISSAAYMVANTVIEIMNVESEVLVDDSGKMLLKIKKEDFSICKDILLGFKLHMFSLEEQYPENIAVNYVEV